MAREWVGWCPRLCGVPAYSRVYLHSTMSDGNQNFFSFSTIRNCVCIGYRLYINVCGALQRKKAVRLWVWRVRAFENGKCVHTRRRSCYQFSHKMNGNYRNWTILLSLKIQGGTEQIPDSVQFSNNLIERKSQIIHTISPASNVPKLILFNIRFIGFVLIFTRAYWKYSQNLWC